MPDFDVQNDTVPQNKLVVGKFPTIAAMKSALSTYNSTSYSTARLNTMTEIDLKYACLLHGLTVAGL